MRCDAEKAAKTEDVVGHNTAKRYSFLWSRHNTAVSKRSHFDSMQEVLSERIVRGSLGLDLGCGRGWDVHIMAERNPSVRLVGMDVSEGVYTARQANSNLKNAVVIRGSASQIPLKTASCDFVYSFGVLHHMHDYKKGFREIHRVLKEKSPVFIYLYEDHCDNPVKHIGIKLVSAIRKITVKIHPKALFFLSCLISPIAVIVFSYPSKIFRRYKHTYRLYEKMPFNFGNSLFSLKSDLYDRFAVPVENRFSKEALREVFAECDFVDVKITRLKATAGWVATAYRNDKT